MHGDLKLKVPPPPMHLSFISGIALNGKIWRCSVITQYSMDPLKTLKPKVWQI